ncbi:MAG: hypothetical protein K2X94_00520, partial [Amoebophilaceae bacterium]|nr:hypothetical protein [Amoebophilaceae bacterium]
MHQTLKFTRRWLKHTFRKNIAIMRLLSSRTAALALVAACIQQLMVASSTLWIALLSTSVVLGSDYRIYLFFFIGSLIVVYIPAIAYNYHLEKAKAIALKKCISLFSTTYYGMPTLAQCKNFRAEQEPWIVGESQRVIDEAYKIFYDGFSMVLNACLNIGVLSIAVNPTLLLGYGIAILIMPITLYLF